MDHTETPSNCYTVACEPHRKPIKVLHSGLWDHIENPLTKVLHGNFWTTQKDYYSVILYPVKYTEGTSKCYTLACVPHRQLINVLHCNLWTNQLECALKYYNVAYEPRREPIEVLQCNSVTCELQES